VCNFVFHNHLNRNFYAKSSLAIILFHRLWHICGAVCVCVCVCWQSASGKLSSRDIFTLQPPNLGPSAILDTNSEIYLVLWCCGFKKEDQRNRVCRAWPPFFVSVCKCIWLKPDNSDELYSISTSANMYKVLHPASNSPCLSCLHMRNLHFWLNKLWTGVLALETWCLYNSSAE